jgi:hypothetical protein
MQENNITWFMVTERTDLNAPILQKELPKEEDFSTVEYVIQEKDTLRFATQTESDKLRESSSISEKVLEIQKNSYGRLAMAYQRARNRFKNLLNLYREVFEFKLTTDILTIRMNKNPDKFYTSYYQVEVKETYKSLTLKKVLEILQVYNFSELKDEDSINGSIPILVTIPLGSSTYQFLLSKNSSKTRNEKLELNQITVSTRSTNGSNTFIASTYTKLLGIGSRPETIHKDNLGIKAQYNSPIKEEIKTKVMMYPHCTEDTKKFLQVNPRATNRQVIATLTPPSQNDNDWSNKMKTEDQRELASYLKSCLDSKLDEQPEEIFIWKQQKDIHNQIVELIALTQIVESNHGPDYNHTRTLGMNKLAREILRQIAVGENTFRDAFNTISNNSTKAYPPIGFNGATRARQSISKVEMMHYVDNGVNDYVDCYSTRCDEMSSDSDEEISLEA